MARSKRTNFAKAKVWMEHMTAEVEGSIAGVSVELFKAIAEPAVREVALRKIQEWHAAALEREAQPQTTSATSA